MRYIIIISLLLLTANLPAQYRYSKWVIGEGTGYNSKEQILIDFLPNRPTSTLLTSSIDFRCENCPTICNEAGELQFYSNGRLVLNRNGDLMENGDGFPYGYLSYNYDPAQGFDFYVKNSFILPDFNKPQTYYYFYIDQFHGTDGTYLDEIRTSLYYLKVDMSQNNGLGKVVEKNVPVLLRDSLTGYLCFTPIRHANGRDWWFITNEAGTNTYHRVLWSPDGFKTDFPPFTVAGPDTIDANIIPYSRSIDGSKFAVGSSHSMWVYDFNRCSGMLSNPIKLTEDTIDFHWVYDLSLIHI